MNSVSGLVLARLSLSLLHYGQEKRTVGAVAAGEVPVTNHVIDECYATTRYAESNSAVTASQRFSCVISNAVDASFTTQCKSE